MKEAIDANEVESLKQQFPNDVVCLRLPNGNWEVHKPHGVPVKVYPCTEEHRMEYLAQK